MTPRSPQQTVYLAVVNENLELLQSLLDPDGKSVEELEAVDEQLRFREEKYGRTPLHMAAVAMASGPAMMRRLLTAGADPSVTDNRGRTPLLDAICSASNTKCLRCCILFEYEADPNQADDTGMTPLLAAWVQPRCAESALIIHRLLDQEVDPNVRWPPECTVLGEDEAMEQNTMLHWAIKQGDRKCVNKLLARGALVDSRNSLGQTPLHRAAQNWECGLSVMMVLLQVGKADPLATDDNGSTPLMEACKHQHGLTSRVDVLVEAIPDPKQHYLNMVDDEGCTALDRACRNRRGRLNALQLLEAGADPCIGNNSSTALIDASKHASGPVWREVVAKLLTAGVDPNISDECSRTALYYAASDNSVDVQVVDILLAHGASPNKADHHSELPLVVACRMRNESKVFILLQAMLGQGSIHPMNLAHRHDD